MEEKEQLIKLGDTIVVKGEDILIYGKIKEFKKNDLKESVIVIDESPSSVNIRTADL